MTINQPTLRQDYWESTSITESDLDFLYNFLLEIETPQTPQELVRAIIAERIRQEKQQLESQQQAEGLLYRPKDHYLPDQQLIFPAFDWKKARVTAVRPGNNPELPPFEVIEVKFDDGMQKQFAAGLKDHVLNQPIVITNDDPLMNMEYVLKTYGQKLMHALTEKLEANPDLVRIAGRWFPRALLLDVNIGHLNLAEAVLDMEGGGPVQTKTLLEQVELPTDVNLKLTEFSMNLALQEDGRFDEVGPAGQVLWFLRRLEPAYVKEPPIFLKHRSSSADQNESGSEYLHHFDNVVCDELETLQNTSAEADTDEIKISLIYPHWRAGTLPLCPRLNKFFPTAYESPRVIFTFIDGDTGQKINGWVICEHNYAYGLRDWYVSQGLFPGSLLHIRHGDTQGEVIIRAEKRRPTREWIRTALVGVDGGIVFAMLKQMVVTNFDDRLAIAIPDSAAIDQMWESGNKFNRGPLENTVQNIMRELAKLNPQGHVHAQELYAAVNIIRRCPPGLILNLLAEKPWATHLGDLYFRLEEKSQEEKVHD